MIYMFLGQFDVFELSIKNVDVSEYGVTVCGVCVCVCV